LISNIIGHVAQGVEEPALSRVFEYWRKIDKTVGDRVEEGVRRPR
jgi:catalase